MTRMAKYVDILRARLVQVWPALQVGSTWVTKSSTLHVEVSMEQLAHEHGTMLQSSLPSATTYT